MTSNERNDFYMKKKQMLAVLTALSMGLAACAPISYAAETESSLTDTTEEEKSRIESTLDLANNKEVTWNYDSATDSWTMSVTAAVADPELPDYQGVSVNVPGAYVLGIDTDGDGSADISAENWSEAVNGTLVINEDGEIQNENGQTYTAKTAPVVINTGAAGYSAQQNQLASSSNAAYGYINVACGNRGKQSTAEDETRSVL